MKTAVIISIIVFIILLIVGGFVFYFKFLPQQAIGCRLEETGEKELSFYCSYDECEIQGSGYCDESNPFSYVTFRTSSNDYQSGWIAFDSNNDGILEGYKFKEYLSRFRCSREDLGWTNYDTKTPEDYDIAKWEDYYCISSRVDKGDVVIIKTLDFPYYDVSVYGGISQDAILVSAPVTGYQNKETYSQYLYFCEADLKTSEGQILEHKEYTGNEPLIFITNKYVINKNIGVDFGGYKISYSAYNCGPCGECEIGNKECKDSITIKECISDTEGCGLWQTTTVPLNNICLNGLSVKCNDNDICTNDVRNAGETECTFILISNCCKSIDDCDDNNVCTSDKCSGNQCVNTPILDCCDPPCDSNHECINQNCELKQGCKYSNPDCKSPQICNTITNQCVCPTGGDYCSALELNNEICKDNSIYICIQEGNCYVWNLKETCGEEEICI